MQAFIYFLDKALNFLGWGKSIYEASDVAKDRYSTKPTKSLALTSTDIMFGEDADALKQTQVTPTRYISCTLLFLSECDGYDGFQARLLLRGTLWESSLL